jgi:hypothetical protein
MHQETEQTSALNRTKLCSFHAKGQCKHGNQCCFAHGEAELQEQPNLLKTRLCKDMQDGWCVRGTRCKFAHSIAELRPEPPMLLASSQQLPVGASSSSSTVPLQQHYNTQSTSSGESDRHFNPQQLPLERNSFVHFGPSASVVACWIRKSSSCPALLRMPS